jgi:hypothetical protein
MILSEVYVGGKEYGLLLSDDRRDWICLACFKTSCTIIEVLLVQNPCMLCVFKMKPMRRILPFFFHALPFIFFVCKELFVNSVLLTLHEFSLQTASLICHPCCKIFFFSYHIYFLVKSCIFLRRLKHESFTCFWMREPSLLKALGLLRRFIFL